jgi:hypothetical protein
MHAEPQEANNNKKKPADIYYSQVNFLNAHYPGQLRTVRA